MKPLNDKKTDIAWQRLYCRLEEEKLIENTSTAQKKSMLPLHAIGWAAVIAIVIFSLVTIITPHREESLNSQMYTLQSEDENSTLVTSLKDGSIICLAKQSTIKYSDLFAETKREVILNGNAYFDIAKSQKPFIIETPKAFVEVLGTAFSIENNNNTFSLYVQRGKVKVTPKDDRPAVFVESGEKIWMGSEKLEKTKISDSTIFSKYFKRTHFKDQRLTDIVRSINLNSDSITIKLAPQLEDKLLTVSFLDNDPVKIAKLIALALNLKTKQDSSSITILDED